MRELLNTLFGENTLIFEQVKNRIPRQCRFPDIDNKIKVAIGMRRVGKTTFLFQEMQRIMQEHHVPWQRILYLNFEDDRLLPCSQQKLRTLLETFYQMYPENHNERCYLFLDEIQNVDEWSVLIRRFFDTKNIQLYLTGSSAKLLSKEIASTLRGRSIATEIWPFSFSEYLIAKNVTISFTAFGQKQYDLLYQQLLFYFQEGGFPEISRVQPVVSRQVLQDYIELVLMRDIVERYLIQTLIKNTSCIFSVTKFFNDVKSQGIVGSKGVIYEYLDYLDDAYLIFPVFLFSESMRRMHSNPRKTYAIDPGLVNAFSFSLNKNYGHLFETIVFLDLKRQGHKIYYYLTAEGFEIDFLTEDRYGERHLYQVVWDTHDEKTLAREQRALAVAEKELGINGEMITPYRYLSLTQHT
jgi:uncharacterized protein